MAESRRCDETIRRGRLAKARQFLMAAEAIETIIDDHAAVALLSQVDKDSAKHLKRLLDMKTRAGYGASPRQQQSNGVRAVLRALCCALPNGSDPPATATGLHIAAIAPFDPAGAT